MYDSGGDCTMPRRHVLEAVRGSKGRYTVSREDGHFAEIKIVYTDYNYAVIYNCDEVTMESMLFIIIYTWRMEASVYWSEICFFLETHEFYCSGLFFNLFALISRYFIQSSFGDVQAKKCFNS